MQIYLARNNQQAGPYSLDQLNQMLASQQVLLTDLIWHQGMNEWQTVASVTQGQLHYAPNPPDIVNRTTTVIDIRKRPTETVNSKQVATPILASLPQRGAAKVIDLMLWLPISLIPSAFMSSEQQRQIIAVQDQLMNALAQSQIEQAQAYNFQILQLIPNHVWLMMLIYLVGMLALQAWLIYKSGQSVGKKVMGLHIVSQDQYQRVGLGRAFFLRSLVFIVFNLFTNFLISLLDYGLAVGKKRQTLHDRLARTQVITAASKVESEKKHLH